MDNDLTLPLWKDNERYVMYAYVDIDASIGPKHYITSLSETYHLLEWNNICKLTDNIS